MRSFHKGRALIYLFVMVRIICILFFLSLLLPCSFAAELELTSDLTTSIQAHNAVVILFISNDPKECQSCDGWEKALLELESKFRDSPPPRDEDKNIHFVKIALSDLTLSETATLRKSYTRENSPAGAIVVFRDRSIMYGKRFYGFNSQELEKFFSSLFGASAIFPVSKKPVKKKFQRLQTSRVLAYLPNESEEKNIYNEVGTRFQFEVHFAYTTSAKVAKSFGIDLYEAVFLRPGAADVHYRRSSNSWDVSGLTKFVESHMFDFRWETLDNYNMYYGKSLMSSAQHIFFYVEPDNSRNDIDHDRLVMFKKLASTLSSKNVKFLITGLDFAQRVMRFSNVQETNLPVIVYYDQATRRNDFLKSNVRLVEDGQKWASTQIHGLDFGQKITGKEVIPILQENADNAYLLLLKDAHCDESARVATDMPGFESSTLIPNDIQLLVLDSSEKSEVASLLKRNLHPTPEFLFFPKGRDSWIHHHKFEGKKAIEKLREWVLEQHTAAVFDPADGIFESGVYH